MFRKERAKCLEEQTLTIQLGQHLEETKKTEPGRDLVINEKKKEESQPAAAT